MGSESIPYRESGREYGGGDPRGDLQHAGAV